MPQAVNFTGYRLIRRTLTQDEAVWDEEGDETEDEDDTIDNEFDTESEGEGEDEE